MAPSASKEEGDQLTYHSCTFALSGSTEIMLLSVLGSIGVTFTLMPICASCCSTNCIPFISLVVLSPHMVSSKPFS